MANKLNMAIAKSHRLSTRLVGMQITLGTLFGLVLSAMQTSIGFIVTVNLNNSFLNVLIFMVGTAMSVIVERLSLGGLSSVRESSELIERYENDYSILQLPSEHQTKLFEKRMKDEKRKKSRGWKIALVGILLSAVLGDLFWSWLFKNLNPPIYRNFMAIMCALVISLTFIHSELFKKEIDRVIKSILSDMSVMQSAVSVEEKSMQLDVMVDSYDESRKDKEAMSKAREYVKYGVAKRMNKFAKQVSDYSIETINVVEGSVTPLLLPSPTRGMYNTYKSELIRLRSSNPSMSQGDLAKHFQVSKSTINGWIEKLARGE